MTRRNTLLLIINTFFYSGFLFSQVSIPLSSNAQIIGSANTFDYDRFECSTTINTKENAFDGNLSTIFATCERSGGWVGLDLGKRHVITKVAYCPREDEPDARMLLGVFEGANNADFGDAIPIYMITEAPEKNKMTEKNVHCTRGFRYVRYVGPDDVKCNLAELEFYGYEDNGDNSRLYQPTNLPVVIIHTKDNKEIQSRSTYIKGFVTIISEDGTKFFNDSLEIRGRGNASWAFPKKPYRMKLYNKSTLLDFPAKVKNWTLINNYGDKTLMRNLLAFDLSQRFDMPYTPAGRAVDVFLNGEYKGCYQLCDQVEVKPGRVEVEEMQPDYTSFPELTGGYLIEIDAYAGDEPPERRFYSNPRGIPVTIKYPKQDELVPIQKDYIEGYFNTMVSKLYATNYTNSLTGYRSIIHTPTFIRHFLIGELSGNTDTYWSVFMYKKREDNLFYTGPVWDFDLAYENDNRTYPINNKTRWIYEDGGSSANGMPDFVNRLFRDPSFLQEVKDIYAEYRNKGVISEEELVKVVDLYEEELQQSQALNFTRWKILNEWVHQNPRVYGSYRGEVNNVRNYIKNRIAWMDNKLGYIPTAITDNLLSEIRIKTTSNEIHIENISSPIHISLFDLTGKLIKTERIQANHLLSVSKGVYLLQITDPDGKEIKTIKCVIP
ncbi:MAG: CotH kinase family protein [Candidatus Azobacteroides sp.]|nr:CotH kinase family protein [Candidatus Azobacteroides sp.]